MPHNRPRLFVALALVALVFLSSAHATALPQAATIRSAGERPEAAPGLFSRIWNFFSVWTIGSGLEPNGADTNAGPGTDPGTTGTDIGSILDPNG